MKRVTNMKQAAAASETVSRRLEEYATCLTTNDFQDTLVLIICDLINELQLYESFLEELKQNAA